MRSPYIRKLCPDDNVLTELGVILEGSSESGFGKPHQSNDDARPPRLSYDIAASAISKVNNPDDPRDDQDDDVVSAVLLDNLKRLEIGKVDSRFFGKSSGVMLVQTAMELKSEYTGSDYVQPAPSMILENKRPEFWSRNPVSSDLSFVLAIILLTTVVGTRSRKPATNVNVRVPRRRPPHPACRSILYARQPLPTPSPPAYIREIYR